MNGKKAKRIRREFYGGSSTSVDKYYKLPNGQIIAGPERQGYKSIKKERKNVGTKK
jgi:hypothetical protein